MSEFFKSTRQTCIVAKLQCLETNITIADVTFDLAILCNVNKRLLYYVIMITINKFLVCGNKVCGGDLDSDCYKFPITCAVLHLVMIN